MIPIKSRKIKISFSSQKINGKVIIREFDGAWKRMIDEDAVGYYNTASARLSSLIKQVVKEAESVAAYWQP